MFGERLFSRRKEGHHLVVIDLQDSFMWHKDPIQVERALQVTLAMIEVARLAEIPITFIMYSQQGELLPGLEPKGKLEKIVVKNNDDAFSKRGFARRVARAQFLHLAGCNLEFCVRKTVDSAVKRKHKVVLYRNALLSKFPGTGDERDALTYYAQLRNVFMHEFENELIQPDVSWD